ncbi:MAG: hydroxyphenylacetyl-CoA thioesterase PaaI [Pseudomonadota bacterium]
MNLASRAADALWADDRAARELGITLIMVDEGFARLSLKVRAEMTNGHSILHGGFIFTLADTAFAYACNSSGQRTVASQCTISFLAPAKFGDTLVATAREVFREGRQGITDVVVETDEGRVVAHFRGNSRTIKGSLFDEPLGEPNDA